jgi:hypothetical protein
MQELWPQRGGGLREPEEGDIVCHYKGCKIEAIFKPLVIIISKNDYYLEQLPLL